MIEERITQKDINKKGKKLDSFFELTQSEITTKDIANKFYSLILSKKHKDLKYELKSLVDTIESQEISTYKKQKMIKRFLQELLVEFKRLVVKNEGNLYPEYSKILSENLFVFLDGLAKEFKNKNDYYNARYLGFYALKQWLFVYYKKGLEKEFMDLLRHYGYDFERGIEFIKKLSESLLTHEAFNKSFYFSQMILGNITDMLHRKKRFFESKNFLIHYAERFAFIELMSLLLANKSKEFDKNLKIIHNTMLGLKDYGYGLSHFIDDVKEFRTFVLRWSENNNKQTILRNIDNFLHSLEYK